MTPSVLWDSSAILAWLDADDEHHAAAMAASGALASERRAGIITNYIEAEAHALLLSRLGRNAAWAWLQRRPLTVVRLTRGEEERARSILARYRDKDWSLCDAMSFALLEVQNIQEAFTYDHHFAQWGKCRIRG